MLEIEARVVMMLIEVAGLTWGESSMLRINAFTHAWGKRLVNAEPWHGIMSRLCWSTALRPIRPWSLSNSNITAPAGLCHRPSTSS